MPLLYGAKEYLTLTRKNRIKPTGFLSGDRIIGLQKLFGHKQSGDGKVKIEIGWQELKINYKEKKKARTGQDMMVIKFWKAPATGIDGKKYSYDTIDCYSILQREAYGEFSEEWFKPFTTCLDEQSFAGINKGDKFWCLIMYVEKLFEKSGEIVKYERGEKSGQDIVIIEPQIIRIQKEQPTNKPNYFKLYKPLDNGNSNQ